MNEDLKTTKFLFDKIKKLYPTFAIPDEFDIDCWVEVLEGYSQNDILAALKDYRKTVEYNTPPTPGTFAKFLKEVAGFPQKKTLDNSSVDVKPSRFDESNWRYWVGVDLARAFMMRGQLAGKNIARCFYDRAVKDILAHRVDTLPGSSGWSYGERVKVAFQNNFFDDVDLVAEQIQHNEISHLPPLKNPVNFLAAHWKVGD